jgi:DNA-binding beta-propeller fold protein YncE
LKLTRRGVAAGVTATVALFAGGALVGSLLTPPGPPGPGTPPASVGVVTRTEAASVAFDAAGGWLVDDHDGTVRRFDTATGRPLGRALHVGGRPIAVTTGYGHVWVADISGSRVWEIDPATGRAVGAPIAVAQGPVSLIAGDGGVWVASLLAGTVSLIDPHARTVEAWATLPDGAVRLALGPDGVWVSGQTHTLTRISPRPARGTLRYRTVGVGQGPLGVASGDGAVWVANVQSGTVSRIDPASVRVTATYAVPGPGGGQANPETVAVWQDRLWVADGQQGVVEALDPSTGAQVGAAVRLPGVLRQFVLDAGGTLWGTTANPGTVVRFS